VARQSELNLLTDRWQQACSGDGQVVLLSGEAGIGKSRILHELRETLSSTVHASISYQCSPFNANTPFYPIIEQLGKAAGFSKNDTYENRLDKLERLVAETPGRVDTDAPLLAALMALPIDRYPHLELLPQQQKMETINVLVEQLVRLSTDSPVIVIVEDIHWIDPSTLEVFDAFVDSLQKLPVLLIMTHRPGIAKHWEGFGHITQISLNRLGQQEMRALVARISGGSALPESVIEKVLQRTDGVPLFVEELIKTVQESELVQESGDLKVSAGNPPPMLIPTTLRDSLMARLDRLVEVKEVAQAAACIGREFSYELLASIVDTDDLSKKLDLLVDSGLVFRRRSGERDRFVFKHALVQDAAYESLLKSRRKDLHGRIAAALEQEFADKTGTVLELLAHHYSEAGLIEPALQYWLKAGQQSAKLCAHIEAIAHLRRGLAIVDSLPEGEDKARHEIEFRVDLGVPLQNKEGVASQIVYENYLRAQTLCEQLGENEHLYPILWGLWFHHYINSQLPRASEMADRLLEVGENRKDTELVLEAHHCQWASQFTSGELSSALEHCNHGVRLYRTEEHHALTFTYGDHDPGACARYVSGAVLWLMGYPEQSQERYDSAFRLARELDHSTTLSTALAIFLQTCIWRRDEVLLQETADELLKFAENGNMPDIESIARGVIGWVKYQRGDKQEGLEMMHEEVDRWLKLGIAWASAPISLYAECLAETGDLDEGLRLLDHSIKRGQADDVRWCEAQLYHVKGNLLLIGSTGNKSGAEEMYWRAIEVARGQNAKSVELRASMSMALLLQSTGKPEQALELLQPVYDWFTEGLDTKDLVQAKELLVELKCELK